MNRKEQETLEIAIIGAGASGLVLATRLAQKIGGKKVGLIEKNDRVGKKLLSTGNGQCNFANATLSSDNFYGENPTFVNNIIDKYGVKELIEFYSNLGVMPLLDGDKYYPYSKQASSVVDAFRFKLRSLNVIEYLGVNVIDIKRENDVFKLIGKDGFSLYAKRVVLAVGGKSSAFLGSDGNSYSLYQKFGHTITNLYPSLVQLKCDSKCIRGLKGLKQKVKITAHSNLSKQSVGDVLFTDYGLSGNAVFSVSPCFAGQKGYLEIDFCPSIDDCELLNFLNLKAQNCDYLGAEYLFSGIVNTKIASAILKNSGFNLSQKISSINLKNAVQVIKNYKIEVLSTMGFDNSQVTRGGLKTCEFDEKTLESKLQSGLYATGEVLDVDGDCGGYNLQWAFSSACAVCEDVLRKI